MGYICISWRNVHKSFHRFLKFFLCDGTVFIVAIVLDFLFLLVSISDKHGDRFDLFSTLEMMTSFGSWKCFSALYKLSFIV